MKKLLKERFQELAGIKPLYEADPEAIKGKHYPDDETICWAVFARDIVSGPINVLFQMPSTMRPNLK